MILSFISQSLTVQQAFRVSSTSVEAPAPTNKTNQTPEDDEATWFQAMRLREKEAGLRYSEHMAQMQAHGDRESNEIISPNVATLDYDMIKLSLGLTANTIRTQNPGSYTFYGANGKVKTRSIHEYYEWLQLREKEMTDDGTYSPAIILSNREPV